MDSIWADSLGIAFGELEGGEWDWGALRWKEK